MIDAERSDTKLLQQLTTITGKDGSYRFPWWDSKPKFEFRIMVDIIKNTDPFFFS